MFNFTWPKCCFAACRIFFLNLTFLVPLESESEDDCQSGLNSDVTVAYSVEECEHDTVEESQDCDALPAEVKELRFWYIDPDGRMVVNKDQAAVSINGRTASFLFYC